MGAISRILAAFVLAVSFCLPAYGATATLFPLPKFQAWDAAGILLSGGLVYTYEAGTDTPLDTYTSSTGATANANPVVLDSTGQANIWFDGSKLYKVVLKTSAGVTLYTVDNVGLTSGSMSFLQSGTGAVTESVQTALRRVCFWPEQFGATGNGSVDDTVFVQRAITASINAGSVCLQKGKTYRITAALNAAGAIIEGDGTLYIDFDSVSGNKPVYAIGTRGNSVALTSNVAASDTKAVVADATSFAIGDLVELGDTRWSGGYPVRILRVRSITATDINFWTTADIPYTTANSAYVRKLTPTSLVLRDITVSFSPSSDTEIGIYCYVCDPFTVDGVKIANQRGDSNPTATTAIAAEYSNNVSILNNVGTASTAYGAFAYWSRSGNGRINFNTASGYAFGVTANYSYGGEITGNELSGVRALATGRGIKTLGVIGINVHGNPRIDNFTTMLKIEDTGYSVFANNVGAQIGVATSDHAINISESFSGSGAAVFNKVIGNLLNTTTGNGIYSSAQALKHEVIGNTVISAAQSCMFIQGNTSVIANNRCDGFGVSGIVFSQLTSVTGNWVFDSTNTRPSFSTNGSFSAGQPNGTLTGNVAYNNPWDGATEAQAITNITQANPAVLTYVGADNFANGDSVYIGQVAGMTEVNGITATVANVNTGANTFELSGINSTGYGAYSSGGVVQEQARVDLGKMAVGKNSIKDLNWDRGYTNFSSVSTSGTGEDDLMTTVIPAGALGTFHGVLIRAAGTKTGSAGNKTVKIYFGSSAFIFNAAANDTNTWRVELFVWNTTASAQRITAFGLNGTTVYQTYAATTENTANATTVKVTGEAANGGDTITQTMMTIDYMSMLLAVPFGWRRRRAANDERYLKAA